MGQNKFLRLSVQVFSTIILTGIIFFFFSNLSAMCMDIETFPDGWSYTNCAPLKKAVSDIFGLSTHLSPLLSLLYLPILSLTISLLIVKIVISKIWPVKK